MINIIRFSQNKSSLIKKSEIIFDLSRNTATGSYHRRFRFPDKKIDGTGNRYRRKKDGERDGTRTRNIHRDRVAL